MGSHGEGKRVRRRQATEAANEGGGLELHRGGMHPPFVVSEPQPAFSPETPREDAATCADRIGQASCVGGREEGRASERAHEGMVQQASLTLADSHTMIPTEGNLADAFVTQRLAAYEGGQQPVLIWICKSESPPLYPYTPTPHKQRTASTQYTDKQAGRQAGRQVGRQADRFTHTPTHQHAQSHTHTHHTHTHTHTHHTHTHTQRMTVAIYVRARPDIHSLVRANCGTRGRRLSRIQKKNEKIL
jgi:hypothetical protein